MVRKEYLLGAFLVAAIFPLYDGIADDVPAQVETKEPPITPQTHSFETSFSLFKDICFKPLPDSETFFAAKDTTGLKWKKLKKNRESKLGLGDRWLSGSGLISYQYLSTGEFSITDPVCDFEFNTDDNFNHQLAVQEISTFLLLDSKNISDKDAKKACWQGVLDDGRRIRFRLSSGYSKSGVAKAKIMIGYIKKFRVGFESQLRRSGAFRCQ